MAISRPQLSKFLNAWLRAASIKKDWLFRKVISNRVGPKPLHPYTVNRIIKGAANAARLDTHIVESLSGHSMRVGAAQDLMADGMGLLPIMQAGGWKSLNVIGRYVEHAEIALCGQMRQRFSADIGRRNEDKADKPSGSLGREEKSDWRTSSTTIKDCCS